MSKAEKLLAKMANNPLDWNIEQVKTVATTHGLEWRQPGTSHVTFRHPNGAKLSIPAHKPIKPVYIRRFLRLVQRGLGD